jgi:hypothetical protein
MGGFYLAVAAPKSCNRAAHHGIAQRLPLHPRQPRRFRPRHALQRVGDGEHPRGGGAGGFPPGQPPQRRRRHVIADRKPFAVHRARPVQVRPQRHQKAPRRAKSQASQFQRGPV